MFLAINLTDFINGEFVSVKEEDFVADFKDFVNSTRRCSTSTEEVGKLSRSDEVGFGAGGGGRGGGGEIALDPVLMTGKIVDGAEAVNEGGGIDS